MMTSSGSADLRHKVYDAVHQFNTQEEYRPKRQAFGHLIEPYYTKKGASPLFLVFQWLKSFFGLSNFQQASKLLTEHVWSKLSSTDGNNLQEKMEVAHQVSQFLKGVSSLALIRSTSDPATWSNASLPKGTAYSDTLTLEDLAPQTPPSSPNDRSSSPVSSVSGFSPLELESPSAASAIIEQSSRDFDGRGQYFLWNADQKLWLPLPCDAMSVSQSLSLEGADEQAIQTAMLVGTQTTLNELSTRLMPESPPADFKSKFVKMDNDFGYTVYFAVEEGKVKVRVEGRCQVCDLGQREGPQASVTAFYDPKTNAQQVALRSKYL